MNKKGPGISSTFCVETEKKLFYDMRETGKISLPDCVYFKLFSITNFLFHA